MDHNPTRAPGWYWILIDGYGWEPARYYITSSGKIGTWDMLHETYRAIDADDIKEINENRIKSPDES